MSSWNTLITSGAYIGDEMQAEFGRIPPAFLPIGNAYLLQHQIGQLAGRSNVWLTLPSDYELGVSQQRLIDDHKVRLIRVNPQKPLGLSVFQSVLEMGPDDRLEIAHGDTLVELPPMPSWDEFSVGAVPEQYNWGTVETVGSQIVAVLEPERSDTLTHTSQILSGYFAFRSPWSLIKCLVAADFEFVQALDLYCREVDVAADLQTKTLDCGHLKTYSASRQSLASARHFNSLIVDGAVVSKRSDDSAKIDAEANWLRSIPADLQPFTARLIEQPNAPTSGEYHTLYSTYPTLAELSLARSSQFVWQRVLDSCIDFMSLAAQHTVDADRGYFNWLIVEKLRTRIANYPNFLPGPGEQVSYNGTSIGSLDEIAARVESELEAHIASPTCIMHGDFCFSNILFDPRSGRIILIDPRGIIGAETTIYGDIRYDIAKLGHSIVGRYDQILGEGLAARRDGNDFAIDVPEDEGRSWLEDEFLSRSVEGVSFHRSDIQAAIVSLFLSMVPLHSEDRERQLALYANGLRLYTRFFI